MLKLYVGIIGSVLLLMFTVIVVADPPSREAEVILDKFELIRPQERDLSLFKLDWEKTLKSALARAAREDRPVLLILVRNSNGDIFQGHC